MDGFLNVLKPPGMSSHDIVGAVRRILREKRVGHGGTLDPAAAGVLPVAVGRATRLIEYLSMADKSYRAELLFGMETDSGDDTGRVIASCEDFVMPAEERLREILGSFQGVITQVPPKYSAIKIDGRRACDLTRQDVPVEMPARQVEIYRLELLARRDRTMLIETDCSKGTYIRTLCADIGRAAGIPATMSFLLRTRAGGFHLRDACTLEELKQMGEQAVLQPAPCLSHIPRFDLPEHRRKAFCSGLSTRMHGQVLPELLCVYSGGEFLGIGRYDAASESVCPVKVYN